MLDTINAGGPVVWVLCVMSILAVTVAIFKLLQFIAMGVYGNPVDAELELWAQGQQGEALARLGTRLQKRNQPLPDMVYTAMQGVNDPAIDVAEAREAAARVGGDALERLRSGFRLLEFIATTAPLLGLLGTVLGMMTAFEKMKEAGQRVDVSVLSGGISEALLTTAAGLIVAIPTVFMLSFLERRLEHFQHRLESATTRVFTARADTVRAARL